MAALADRDDVSQLLVHTGQHYDANMSEVFFNQLGMAKPDINLGVGSGSHAMQTAQIMLRIEEVLLDRKADLVLVYGDVNSTLAASLVCVKLLIPVCHVEAGLRSFDLTMPEETNRLLTDQVADLLFTPSKDGDENLFREGIAPEKIHLVGNVMIDTLVHLLPKINGFRAQKGRVGFDAYALVTLHRPSNVDEPEMLNKIISTLESLSNDIPIIFPVHPRTCENIIKSKIAVQNSRLKLIEPIGYMEFLSLQKSAKIVITDSGGIQEETTFLGVPCLTVRENTERPITIELGTNTLVGQNMDKLRKEAYNILNGKGKKGTIPPLWDGKASERIAEIIACWF